jgi:hypothetical protein
MFCEKEHSVNISVGTRQEQCLKDNDGNLILNENENKETSKAFVDGYTTQENTKQRQQQLLLNILKKEQVHPHAI